MKRIVQKRVLVLLLLCLVLTGCGDKETKESKNQREHLAEVGTTEDVLAGVQEIEVPNLTDEEIGQQFDEMKDRISAQGYIGKNEDGADYDEAMKEFMGLFHASCNNRTYFKESIYNFIYNYSSNIKNGDVYKNGPLYADYKEVTSEEEARELLKKMYSVLKNPMAIPNTGDFTYDNAKLSIRNDEIVLTIEDCAPEGSDEKYDGRYIVLSSDIQELVYKLEIPGEAKQYSKIEYTMNPDEDDFGNPYLQCWIWYYTPTGEEYFWCWSEESFDADHWDGIDRGDGYEEQEVAETSNPETEMDDFAGYKTVTLGKLPLDGKPADGIQPVVWIVLEEDDEKMLLLSKYNLGTNGYGRVEELNESYYESAFNDEEKALILDTEIITPSVSSEEDISNFPTAVKEIEEGLSNLEAYLKEEEEGLIEDDLKPHTAKLFCLSYQEAMKYLPEQSSRAGMRYNFDVDTTLVDVDIRWWLRSSALHKNVIVKSDGSFDMTERYDMAGIRPAMWVKKQ